MTSEQFDFAAGLKELEAITAWFESDEVDLDKALVKFERGVELASKLRDHLKVVENRVEKIRQKFNAPTEAAEASPAEPDAPSDPALF